MDMQGFYEGKSMDAYGYLGAHMEEGGVVFRTFAPAASKVGLLVEGEELPMEKAYDGNFYELRVDGITAGTPYEYRVYDRTGTPTDHCDPYGFAMELRPDHRSLVVDMGAYRFDDGEWLAQRTDRLHGPLNIYEIHVGSWRTPDGDSWYTYDEMAKRLAPYLEETGYDHVEFMPICEYPADESWGYQNTGFFAPTSRYGTPDDLKTAIDIFHAHGIGVILDFVPVHFAIDPYGLAHYDGTALYEYPHTDVGVSEWGSYNFMHSRGEVRSFLKSATNFWLREYHFDGLRVDAVSRIIYWQGDEHRGVNGNAVDFIKTMNRDLKRLNPGCILVAEDSTDYPGVTLDVDHGGLGFDYKWDMGWMHDTLEFMQMSPKQRLEAYHKLTFSMLYFHNERYLLALSHDEVVHGKATILQKMNGQYGEKFPQARLMYLYMMVHPGKKLNFMGNEFGQLREWDEDREQDWALLDYPAHDGFRSYMATLNGIYETHPALYEWDYEERGFHWLDCHQESRAVYTMERMAPGEKLVAVLNFSDGVQQDYEVKIPGARSATMLLHSDWQPYGGTVPTDEEVFHLEKDHLVCTLPPFSGILLEVEEATGEGRKSPKK